MKLECDVVRDLLPLYAEKMVSERTEKLIEEHLSECEKCSKKILKITESDFEISHTIEPIKELSRAFRKHTLKAVVLAAAAIVIILSVLIKIFIIGTAAKFEDVDAATEIQLTEYYYMDKEWVIHFKLNNGKALNVKNEYVYSTDENGDKTETGCIITLYSVQPSSFLFECDNYTFGYGYMEADAPPPGHDYTVTVRYKDSEKVYRMSEEGLF